MNTRPNIRSVSRGRLAAEAKYRDLRLLALQDAKTALASAAVRAELRPIDAAALLAAEHWTSRRVNWPWHSLVADWRRNHPARLKWQSGKIRYFAHSPWAARRQPRRTWGCTTSRGTRTRKALCAAR
jgi:hypothetical protein